MKYRKSQRGKMKGLAFRGEEIEFGKFALKAKSRGLLSSQEIEAARRAMTRYVQRGGKIWVRVFPDKPITRKALEVPMGAGKGDVSHYAAVILPGRILFEMDGIPEQVAYEALRLASSKLSVQSTFIVKEEKGVE